MKVYLDDDKTHVDPRPYNDILWGLKAHCNILNFGKSSNRIWKCIAIFEQVDLEDIEKKISSNPCLCCEAAVEFILAKNPIAMANTKRVKAIPRKITRAQDDQVSSAVSFEDTSFEVPSTTENN